MLVRFISFYVVSYLMIQKRLMSSLREKKRYVVFEIIGEKISYVDAKKTITDSFKELFGLDGLAKAGLNFVEYEDNKGIIRVSNKCLDLLKGSFCYVRKINKGDVIVRSLGVSGILKKAKFKFIIGGGN